MRALRRFLGPLAPEQRWLTSLIGQNGPRSALLRYVPLGAPLPRAPGVFVIAKRDSAGEWVAIFTGESRDISSRALAHEVMPEALLLGATHVHFCVVRRGRGARIALANQLAFSHGSLLNAAQAPDLNSLIYSRVYRPISADLKSAAASPLRA